ncbi:hypothetical protein JCM8097_000760 [Rhodosporidiobolus ruineniae]
MPPTTLLSLPLEVLDHIVRFVALLRFDYSESRRPRPSALHHLAYGVGNRTLRGLALPYFGREATTASWMTDVWGGGGERVDTRALVRALKQTGSWAKLHSSLTEDFAQSYPNVERIVLLIPLKRMPGLDGEYAKPAHCPGFASSSPAHRVKALEVRHALCEPSVPSTDAFPACFPNLESVNLFQCVDPYWFKAATEAPRVTTLSVTVAERGGIGVPALWPAGLWEKLVSLSLAVLPPDREIKATPIKAYLDGLNLPPTSTLRSLSLSTQLPTRFAVPPLSMRDVVTSTRSTFGQVPLTSLAIDEYASCAPADLDELCSAFPTLIKLELGDRMIWKGSRADFIHSLSPLFSLHTLSCRIFPETPASLFRPSPSRSPSPSSTAAVEEEDQYASPASIALELAAALPRLAMVGFSGRQSQVEWFKVKRGTGEEPDEVESVERYSLELDR